MTFLLCFYMYASGPKKLIMLLHDKIFFIDPMTTINFLKNRVFFKNFQKKSVFRIFHFFLKKQIFDKNKNIKIL
jgi:hypothetical protein